MATATLTKAKEVPFKVGCASRSSTLQQSTFPIYYQRRQEFKPHWNSNFYIFEKHEEDILLNYYVACYDCRFITV